MKAFSLTKQIGLIIVVSAAALFAVGLTGLAQIRTETDSLQTLRDTSLKSVITLTAVHQEFTEARTYAYRLLILDGYRRQTSKKDLAHHIAATRTRLKDYASLVNGSQDQTLLKQDEDMIGAYFKHLNEHILPILDDNPEAAQRLLATQGTMLAQRANTALEAHVRYNRQQAENAATASLTSARQGRLIMETGIGIGLLIVTVLGFLLARDIRVRLNQLASFLDRISETLDFTTRFKVSRQDEVGRAGQSANKLLGNLQQNLQSIVDRAHSVAAAADKLANTSTRAAAAAEQQSEAASSVASTIEEITVSINHVGDEAVEADRLSKTSENLAHEGEQVILQTAAGITNIAQTVNSASTLISDLENSSHKVAGVMTVIKEVAEQTNLLALNAAIEAARAGEQGRGFAVVADEVRKLAERTARSTQEITQTVETMIGMAAQASGQMHEVVDQVGSGVESAQTISQSIRRIGEGCHSAVGTVVEITNAIREQGTATNNIASQVEKIALMSEQSSASAVESSAAATHLDTLAKDMLQIIQAYRLA